MSALMAGKRVPGLEAFSQWLDEQMRRSPDTRAGMLGGILGTAWGLCGALAGILGGALQLQLPLALSPLLLGAGATVYGLVWYFRGRSADEQALSRLYAETRPVVWRMHSLRWRDQLILEEPIRVRLEAGAGHWLRAREAFQSPLWNAAGTDSAHLHARNSAQWAMEAAMARLVLLIGAGAYSSTLETTADNLIEDMRQTADEVQLLIGQYGERNNEFENDPSRDLRAALGELRLLNQAEEEIREIEKDSR
jgi:hypothetical protein